MTHNAQIALFLTQLKESIEKGRFIVINREKNNNFIAGQGITPNEVKEVFFDLQVSDYISGADEDITYPGEKDIWIFKKRYLNTDIYIKIKFLSTKDGFYAKCISFHKWGEINE